MRAPPYPPNALPAGLMNKGCAPCTAYLNTYRKPRDLTAAVTRVPMPDEMKARLRAFLREHPPQRDAI